ncbi:ABC transporter permease subunit [Beduinella massiliensis]|uniref:ABC transporter permease subunit n=1 Tax=Beduinella massiliensis TaxID=1852363 RepID=UPI0011AF4B09
MASRERTAGIRRLRGERVLPYALILPSFLFLTIFLLYPMGRTLANSFMNYQRTKPKQYGFVGLENYVRIFTNDAKFTSSLLISLKWVVVEVGLQVIIGLTAALLLNQKFRGQGFARTLCFAPWAISGVLTGILWMLIYDDNFGLLNNLLSSGGFVTHSYLGDKHLAFGAVVIAELWRGIPFLAITCLAALQSIPEDIYEAAKVDGASRAVTLFRITLPFIRESVVYAALMRCIWAFQSVDLIMTMTNGGPLGRTTTLALYIYNKSVVEGNYGYGSALAMLSFLMLSVFTVIYLRANAFGKEEA